MKYQALYSGYDFLSEDDLLVTLLKNRGVDDPHKLLNLNETCIHDGMLIKNMREGLELLRKHIKNKNRIHVQVDSDTDGYTSSAIIIQYIKRIDKDASITHTMHPGKEHGIKLERLEGYEFDLLIVPDAGTNDAEQSKTLSEKGIDVLILDHHEVELDNKFATVVNCNDGFYPNPTLSGAGVVYKFCKEYDVAYGHSFADDFLDLVAVGIVADSMDLRNYETRYLVLKGVEKLGNGNLFLNEIIEKNAYQIKDSVNITKIGWNIAPYLNGVVRSATEDEKRDTFRALLGEVESKEYKPRKSKNNPNPEVEMQTLQKYMAREVVNIKARQDRELKKGLAAINEKIEIDNDIENDKILMTEVTNVLEGDYTGLVANKLAEKYKRPVILLRDKGNGKFGGSGRSYKLSPIPNLREFLLELNVFDSISGHAGAFGHSIPKTNVELAKEKANELLKDVSTEDVYNVDYEIPVGRLKKKHIKQVGEWEDVWGNTLNEPLFAITDIRIPISKIELKGERKNFISFEVNEIKFIKRFTNEEEYNKMILKQTKGLSNKRIGEVKLDIIGKFKVNEWEGNKYPQIEVVAFRSKENSRFLF